MTIVLAVLCVLEAGGIVLLILKKRKVVIHIDDHNEPDPQPDPKPDLGAVEIQGD
jgi:hypothetical protein